MLSLWFPCCDCTVEYSEDGMTGQETQMDYRGQGVWKCPKCGNVEDLSKSYYRIRVKIEKKKEDKFEWFENKLLEPFDPKLIAEKLIEVLQEEIVEGERFENHEVGLFDFEIIWYDYRCSYEYEEYETVFDVISEQKVMDHD